MRGLTGGLAGGFLGGLLRCLLRGLLLGLPLELGLPFFLGLLFLCGFRFGGKPLFFCLLGLRLLFGEAGFFGFLFGPLPFQPHLLVKIGLQQHGQLAADHRACALSVGIRCVHIAARPIGQAARIHGQQKRPLGPDDADVVLRALVAAVFVRDGRFIHVEIRLEIRVRAGNFQVVDQLRILLLPVPDDLQRVQHHARAEQVVIIVILRDLVVGHGEIFAHGHLVFRPVADAPPEGIRKLVVGIDQRLIVRLVQRSALRDHRVPGDLARELHIIIIQVQRQLVGACAVKHFRLVEVILFAGFRHVKADLEIIPGQRVLSAEVVHQLLQRLPRHIGGRICLCCQRGNRRLRKTRRAEQRCRCRPDFFHSHIRVSFCVFKYLHHTATRPDLQPCTKRAGPAYGREDRKHSCL